MCSRPLCLKEAFKVFNSSFSPSVSSSGFAGSTVGKFRSSMGYSFPSTVTVPFSKSTASKRIRSAMPYSEWRLIMAPSTLNWITAMALCIFAARPGSTAS